MRAFGVTDKGRVRPTNEDCFGIDSALQLLVVADGLGGHNAGEVASRLAVEAVTEHVQDVLDQVAGHPLLDQGNGLWPFGFDRSRSRIGNLLRTAVHVANMRILETALASDELSGMGTTVVTAMVRDGSVSIAHAGDSRLYLLSGDRLRLVTQDDSWIADMLASDPQADRAALMQHPMCHALTNVVGAEPRTTVHVVEEQLNEGDWILLTTDGVHGVLGDERMEQIVMDGGTPEAIAASLVEAALDCGSRDNCTAVVAQYVR